MELYIPNGLFLALGIILIILSIFIWCTKSINMIAPYRDDIEYNEKKLIRWTVLTFLMSGIIITASSALAMVYTSINSAIVFGIVICIMAILVGIGCTKYEL
ncbi:MAG: DUF3784 domain-containing protein [Sarcina sp.]